MPPSTKPKRALSIHGPTPAEKKWIRWLERWRGSALDGSAFCRQRGLPLSSFRFWKKEIPMRERRRQAKRAESEASRAARKAMRLVPVRVVRPEPILPAPGPMEIVLRGGRSLRIGGDFDSALLEKLVTALEAIR